MAWDRHSLRSEVTRRGTTLTAIAQAAGLESSACRTALTRRNRAGEQALADTEMVSLYEVLSGANGPASAAHGWMAILFLLVGGGGGLAILMLMVVEQLFCASGSAFF